MTQPTRRTVAKHTAWAIPTLAIASNAPAVAASTGTSISRSFTVGHTTNSGSTSGSLTVVSNNDGTSFFQIINATSKTTVTGVMASVLVNVSGLSFTTSTGNWAAVQQDPQTYTNAGITYYRYFSTLKVAVPSVTGSTITLPPLSWTSASTSALASAVWVNGRGTATINGVQQVQVGTYRQV